MACKLDLDTLKMGKNVMNENLRLYSLDKMCNIL